MVLLSQEEALHRVREVWGDHYDLTPFIYNGHKNKAKIICPKHGEFEITVNNLLSGHGCDKCRADANKSPIFGVGINDLDNISHTKLYRTWKSMFARCYDPKLHEKQPTYIGCSVDPRWYYLSNFKKWFDENYVEGYALDKDLIVKGNKVYSPDTCCFIPQEINKMLTKSDKVRSKYYIGVYKQLNRYVARFIDRCVGSFLTPEEAFVAYKNAKESYIKRVADEYYSDGRITKRVYDALMRYEVEITD